MELYISTRMTHGIINHQCLNRSHIELYTKMKIVQPLAQEFISAAGKGGMTPNAIADNFHTTRQSVSKHLRILTECELVKQEQQGREIYYSLEIKKMKEIDKWLNQFRKIWETRFNQLDKVLSTIKK